MPRIRVLFVIGTMGGGGAERQVIQILRLIDRNRFDPLLYLATREGELLGSVPTDVPVLAYRDQSPETFWRQLARSLRFSPLLRYLHLAGVLKRERIDVVYDRTYRATLDAAGATWFQPVPRISCCVVDPQPELELQAHGPSSLVWQVARSAYRRANLVLANSVGLRQRVIDYFRLSPDRVATSRNLIDLEQLDHLAEQSLPFFSTEPFFIVAAGRLHPQKGFRHLLQAAHELVHRRGRKLRLLILGTGELETELNDYIQTHELANSVLLTGFVANPLPFYRRAQLFVLPSLYEGSPNALLEAVACGTPALATDCPSGPREILADGQLGGLVPPADPIALADSIEDAMDNHPAWLERAAQARDVIRQKYDAKVGIRELEDQIEHVARKK